MWEGWHWDDNKGGWLDLELRAQATHEEVEYIRRHMMYTRVTKETCLRETGKAPVKTGWAETDKGQATREAQRAREVQDALEARAARAKPATQGAESCVVGDRHGHA